MVVNTLNFYKLMHWDRHTKCVKKDRKREADRKVRRTASDVRWGQKHCKVGDGDQSQMGAFGICNSGIQQIQKD